MLGFNEKGKMCNGSTLIWWPDFELLSVLGGFFKRDSIIYFVTENFSDVTSR